MFQSHKSNRWFYRISLIGLTSFFVLLSIIGISRSYAVVPVSLVPKIDELRFPSNHVPVLFPRKTEGTAITAVKGKDYEPLSAIAEKVIIQASTTADGIGFIAPSFVSASGFEIGKQIDDDTFATMIFDRVSKKILFQIGGYEYQFNNENKVEISHTIAEISNLTPDDAITLYGSTYILGSYRNDAVFTVRQLREVRYSISSPIEANVLSERRSDFRYGLWGAQPADCSRTAEGKSEFQMSQERLGLDSFVRLRSTNHFACTSRVFSITTTSTNLYVFSFDYLARSGGKIRYYYRFFSSDSKQALTKSESIDTDVSQMRTHYTVVKLDKQYPKVELYFYAPSEKGQLIETLYGKPRLREYRQSREERLQVAAFDRMVLGTSNSIVEVPASLTFFSKKNILSAAEASFEEGTWPAVVQDCCASDPGVPAMELSYSSGAVHGTSSLLLTSRSHCACVNKIFTPKFKNGIRYKYSFAYKTVEGNSPQAVYALSGPSKYAVSQLMNPISTSTQWERHSEIIDIGKNVVDAMTLYFYASARAQPLVKNQYDDLRLEEFAPTDLDRYELMRRVEVSTTTGTETISFASLNRFTTAIRLQGIKRSSLIRQRSRFNEAVYVCFNKDQSHSLESSSTFIERLVASLFRSSPCLDKTHHYKLDDASNGWWIDIEKWCAEKGVCKQNPDGSYDIEMTIEFWPQRWFYLGLLISGTTLAGCLGYLAFDGVRILRRKRKAKQTTV